jgi:hypothetical protein
MTVIAGVDIGNSTTEIVLSRDGVPLAWDSRPTRGIKGSPGSVMAAQALLRRIEREYSLQADEVVVAPWHPVNSHASMLHEPRPDTHPLVLIDHSVKSISGDGVAVGMPWYIDEPWTDDACIALVPRTISFNQAAEKINEAVARGADVRACLIEADEAVLITRRLDSKVIALDGVDLSSARAAARLMVEVRPAGTSLTATTDSWAVNSAFNLTHQESAAVTTITTWLAGERASVIGLSRNGQVKPAQHTSAQIRRGHEWIDLFTTDYSWKPGDTTALKLDGYVREISDLYCVDISRELAFRGLRTTRHARALAIAELASAPIYPTTSLNTIFERPVRTYESEAKAAAKGARTTPGISDDAVIIDIGGGTIDLVAQESTSVAGAGALLSAAVAYVLDVPKGAADWIKRTASVRVEAPTVWQTETGERIFTETPTPATFVGALTCPGPAGPIAFGGSLPAADWRRLRLALKQGIIANNVQRLIEPLGRSVDVIAVGGPVADEELIPILRELPAVRGVGRGNVAGVLGHRFAVAYGLSWG